MDGNSINFEIFWKENVQQKDADLCNQSSPENNL